MRLFFLPAKKMQQKQKTLGNSVATPCFRRKETK